MRRWATSGCPTEAPRQARLGRHSTLTQSCASRQLRHLRRCGCRQRTTAILYACPCLRRSQSRQLCRRCWRRPRWSQQQWRFSPTSSPINSKTGARVRTGRQPLRFPSPGGRSPKTARGRRSGKMMKVSPDPWWRHRVASSRRRRRRQRRKRRRAHPSRPFPPECRPMWKTRSSRPPSRPLLLAPMQPPVRRPLRRRSALSRRRGSVGRRPSLSPSRAASVTCAPAPAPPCGILCAAR